MSYCFSVQVSRVRQNVSIPKSLQKSLGLDMKRSGSKAKLRGSTSAHLRNSVSSHLRNSTSGHLRNSTSGHSTHRMSTPNLLSSLSLSSRNSSKNLASSMGNSGRVFPKDAGSTPRRSRHSARTRSSEKENRYIKRKSANFGASIDLHLKDVSQSAKVTSTDQAKDSARRLQPRLCQIMNDNFCISGMSALTISTPPSAYRKMAYGGHTMVTRSMTKKAPPVQELEENVNLPLKEFNMSTYAASPKFGVRKRLSLGASLPIVPHPINPETFDETDFPYVDDSILARGPSLKFAEPPLSTAPCQNTNKSMNVTLTSLHSILEDGQFSVRPTRASARNMSIVSAAPAVGQTHFLTPASKLRKSAKQRNASSTATCTHREKKFSLSTRTPEPSLLSSTVKRSKSVTFSNKKELAVMKASTSERRSRTISLRKRTPAQVLGDLSASQRVEMREDAGHTPKPSRKRQELIDERLI